MMLCVVLCGAVRCCVVLCDAVLCCVLCCEKSSREKQCVRVRE